MKIMEDRLCLIPSNRVLQLLIIILALGLVACDNGTLTKVDYTTYPEYGTARAKLYFTKCGDCHGAPLPNIHPTEKWPSVVNRMQFRMTSKKVVPLNKQEVAEILNYLQENSQ